MATSSTSSAVTAADRLGFTLFFAAALHATLILGIGFEAETRRPARQTMEVTLAQYDDKIKPKDADFLAQANQEGSGDLDEKKELKSPEKAEFVDPEVRETLQVQPQEATVKEQKSVNNELVVTRNQRARVVSDQPREPQEAAEARTAQPSLMQRSLEIASLEAKYSEQRQAYAKRPRVARLTAASTMRTVDAFYNQQWQEKVERIGNINYPEEARINRIYGSLRLLVAINANGTLREVTILQSSGHKILDDAAIRIVRLAAPYAPFPEELRKETDVVEIIRTWKFERHGLYSE